MGHLSSRGIPTCEDGCWIPLKNCKFIQVDKMCLWIIFCIIKILYEHASLPRTRHDVPKTSRRRSSKWWAILRRGCLYMSIYIHVKLNHMHIQRSLSYNPQKMSKEMVSIQCISWRTTWALQMFFEAGLVMKLRGLWQMGSFWTNSHATK